MMQAVQVFTKEIKNAKGEVIHRVGEPVPDAYVLGENRLWWEEKHGRDVFKIVTDPNDIAALLGKGSAREIAQLREENKAQTDEIKRLVGENQALKQQIAKTKA